MNKTVKLLTAERVMTMTVSWPGGVVLGWPRWPVLAGCSRHHTGRPWPMPW
jgi:hypothetical protein